MRSLVLGLAAAAALLGIQAAADGDEDKLRTLFVEFSDLYDPSSVQLRRVRHSDLTYMAWCGELNAKNQYGGYTGWKKFAVRDRRHGNPRDPKRFVQFILEETVGREEVRKACIRDKIYHREDW